MIKDREVEDKLYRVIRKKDSHINTKLNPDGSMAAIQFTDDGNELNGPLDIIEVDEREFMKAEYIDKYDKSRTFQEIIIEDVIVPVSRELLYQAFMIGYDKLCYQMKTKVVPNLKKKTESLLDNASLIAAGIKDGFMGKEPKAITLAKEREENVILSTSQKTEYKEQEKVMRSEEEVADIIALMKMSTGTLAACIRILNNTVIADDGKNPDIRLEIQKNIQTLSTADVMGQIELLLEEKNKGLLDETSVMLLSAFRNGYFIAGDRRIPVAQYKE